MIQRTIDFTKAGITGSPRFKPTPDTAERREQRREAFRGYRAKYVQTHQEQERARWRAVSAKRREEKPELVKAANADHYQNNRQAILEQKRAYYRQNRERILATKAARDARRNK